jgi:hypothetical protein
VLVINHNVPFETCKQGVFVILNDTEREIAAKYIERDNRADTVRRNGNYIP